jgi:uncharacterized protein (DUF952 family)
MGKIYHFINKSDLARDLGADALTMASLESEGFIHCSTLKQVIGVANFIAPYDEEMLLLEIDESLVKPEIRYENLEGESRKFPHVYGPVNRDAIVGQYVMDWDGEDGYSLPEELRA